MIATGTWRFFLLLAFGIRKDTASSFISEWNREDIEHHLSLLNLYETHNRTFHMTPPKPPIYLRRLYRKLDKGEQKDLPSQMRCYLGHGLPPSEHFEDHAIFLFNTTAEGRVPRNVIRNAELRLKFQDSGVGRVDVTGSRAEVRIHYVRKPATKRRAAKLKLLNRTTITTAMTLDSYVTIDVTHFAKVHLSRRRTNLMIHVSLRGLSRRPDIKVPTLDLIESDPDTKPLFLVYLHSKTEHRELARNTRKEKKSQTTLDVLADSASDWKSSGRSRGRYRRHVTLPNQLHCAMKSFRIKFRDIEWDFVIAPTAYDANLCSGECPKMLTESLGPTVHAILQSLFHWTVDSRVSKPCCVPDKLGSLNLLYFDNSDIIVFKQYHGMRATECGCH